MTTPEQPHEPPAGLRIAYVPGVTLTKWRRIWAERFPGHELTILEVTEKNQRDVLVEDLADMCFVRLPIDREDLHAIPLYEEQPVVWMSKDHLLAALDEVSPADLEDVTVLHDAEPGSIELATYCAAVLRVPMSIARSGSRRDLIYLPALEEPTTTVALAWRTDNANPLIDEFIGVVRGRSVNSSRSQRERGEAVPRKAAGRQEKPARAPQRSRARNPRGRGRR